MNIQDRKKTLTVEELRRRYNLDSLDKDRKAIKIAKEQLNKVDSELNNFVEITTKNIKELQDQVDGNITTWFFNGVPTLNNEPANSWTTDEEKINHLGDLYYDQDTGYAYRWAVESNIYSWSKIVDADVVEALAVANSAQDTADSKRRVFVTNPIPPYDIGDIWIKDDQDLYRCRASRKSGTMNIADWILATKYTDDTVALGTKAELDQFKTEVTKNYVTNATLETTASSISGRVEETYTYVTNVEHQVNDITTTTQTSIGGNNLYLEDALESNALEYHIEGKSEQDGTPTPDAPVEIKSIPSIRNLFDKDNANILKAYLEYGTGKIISTTGEDRLLYINIKSNTNYTIKKIKANKFRIGTFVNEPNINEIPTVYQLKTTETTTTIKSGVNDKYLAIHYISPNDIATEQEILDSIMIEEGSIAHDYVPYGAWVKVKITNEDETQEKEVLIDLNIYDEEGNITGHHEICSIGDTKDTLDIVNGQVVIDKKIDDIVLNGSESWQYSGSNLFYLYLNGYNEYKDYKIISNKYKYATWENRLDGYTTGLYRYNTWDTVRLFLHNVNYSTANSFKTYVKEQYDSGTPIIIYRELAEPKQITLPNANIPLFEGVNHISLVDDLETTTSIKYYRNTPIAHDYVVQQQLDETNSNLSNTDNKVSQAQSDINDTNTNLNNNYYNKNQIDVMNTSTEQIITQIKNSVEATTSATNLQISILQEQLTNGVTQVITETGYRFDKDGLFISKTGSEMSSLLDNDGLVVKRNTTEVLTVRSSGVETENLKVRTYFTIGDNTRVENYKGGTGFFYVGGAS